VIILSSWEVSSSEILLRKGIFHPFGLFSEQIFGPRKDYRCQCGKLQGLDYLGKRCDECNVLVAPSLLRRYTMSHIHLPFSIIHPMAIIYLMPPSKTNLLRNVGDTKTYQILEDYIQSNPSKFAQFQRSFPLYLDKIPVLPPTLRPVTFTASNRIKDLDRLNTYYLNILNILEKYIVTDDEAVVNFTKLSILKVAVSLYKLIIQKLTKKEGLIRQSILGKRNDFTGRSVITVDPTLTADTAKIPYRILVSLFQLYVVNELAQTRGMLTAREAVDSFIRNPQLLSLSVREEIKEIVDRLCAQHFILLNRQPTLHLSSIRAFRPIGTDADAIGIPMIVTPGYNADFDGDTMAVYAPLTKAALMEASYMTFDQYPYAPGSRRFNAVTQDIVVGLWYVTKDVVSSNGTSVVEVTNDVVLEELHPHTSVFWRGKTTTAGRAYIESLLDIPISKQLSKSAISELLTNWIAKASSDTIVPTLYKLQRYALKYAACVTISIDDLIEGDLTWKRKYEHVSKWSIPTVKAFSSDAKHAVETLSLSENIAPLLQSGARGKLSQWSQVVALRGLVRNSLGKLILPPILSSLVEGYTPSEMIRSAAGNRKGAVDKALNTAVSGYLARKLVFSLQHLMLGDTDDCGTNIYLPFLVTPQNYKSIIGRYLDDGTYVTYENVSSLIDQEVRLRSPIGCKSVDFCKKCYPYDWGRSKFVGIISAQCISEVATQLVMRTFHLGGAATDTKFMSLPACVDITDDDIVVTNQPVRIELPSSVPVDPAGYVIEEFDVKLHTDTDISVITISEGTRWLLDTDKDMLPPQTPLFVISVKTTDLATDLSHVSRLLNSTYMTTLGDALNQLTKLEETYARYQQLLSIHFEVLWSERLRDVTRTDQALRFSLTDFAVDKQVRLESVANLPHQRLLLSLCFENFRKFFTCMLSSQGGSKISPLEYLIQSNLRGLQEDFGADVVEESKVSMSREASV